jgi:hypothetical protein
LLDRGVPLLRRIPAPVVTGALIVLLGTMIVFWGERDATSGASLRTARVANVRANLADAGCLFTADVQLGSAWQQMAFARIRQDARKQFVTILRNKRRYMVDNPVARQALAAEMAGAVNHLARADIAERVQFSRFEFF